MWKFIKTYWKTKLCVTNSHPPPDFNFWLTHSGSNSQLKSVLTADTIHIYVATREHKCSTVECYSKHMTCEQKWIFTGGGCCWSQLLAWFADCLNIFISLSCCSCLHVNMYPSSCKVQSSFKVLRQLLLLSCLSLIPIRHKYILKFFLLICTLFPCL